jgi:hypothetical protein
MARTTKTALKAIQSLSEAQFAEQFVEPLLRALHPEARVEESHGSQESGRDYICIGPHSKLQRSHVLCVQVKNHQLSPGATTGPYSFATIASQVHTAKKTGVATLSGDVVVPDEVWVITGYPLQEGARRLGAELLREIQSYGAIVVDGVEFIGLLQRHCPRLMAELDGWTDHKLARTIVALSVHRESRAFGLRADRALDEFHVSASVCPSGSMVPRLLAGAIEGFQQEVNVRFNVDQKEAEVTGGSGNGVVKQDLQYSQPLRKMAALSRLFVMPTCWTAEVLRRAEPVSRGASQGGRRSRRDPEDLPYAIHRTYVFDLPASISEVRRKAERAYSRVPKSLSGNVERVAELLSEITAVEGFLLQCKALDAVKVLEAKEGRVPPAFTVESEADILLLGKRVMIEGGPGAGKTTLLRRLAAGLLKAGRRVLFVNAANVDEPQRDENPERMLRRYVTEGTPKEWSVRESIVIIDGLDEAPFELDDAVEAIAKVAPQVLVSARSAFPTGLRNEFLRLEVAPFAAGDRDQFFRRWFATDVARLDRVTSLIRNHSDIEIHTRVPLIATIVAALVERDFEPTTRTEIYKDRLRLLLGAWDEIRGVRRGEVHPATKIRFLEQLAFELHSARGRRRKFTIEDCRTALLNAVGQRGRNLSVERLLEELVVAAGVVVPEPGGYSFGHLSFQEHLAGQYLRRRESPGEVVERLGDDWWREVLRFYAGSRGDITDVIELVESDGVTEAHSEQLLDLVEYAPYTQDVAVEVLKSTAKHALSWERRTERYGESEDSAE